MDESPLSRLPPELRNTIYEYALSNAEPIVINQLECRLWRPPALLRCCSKLQNEASGLYYGSNIFRVDWRFECGKHDSDETLAEWLEVLSSSPRALVRKVYLDDDEYMVQNQVRERLQRCRKYLGGREITSGSIELFVEVVQKGDYAWMSS